jgi:hypothetical protein
MRRLLVVLALLSAAMSPARAQVSVGIGVSVPGVSIGINVPAYPRLVPVPGYPVYYDPYGRSNYFFYDGLYWVFLGDNWYASSWYNGPWRPVVQEAVPLYLLRVPVRYYRQPPPYFHGWRADAPPRWGEHWGPAWASSHRDWDRWDRRRVPPPAPLPNYQRKFPNERYPREVEQQQDLHARHYRYQPREPVVRQQYPQAAPGQGHGPQREGRPVPADRGREPGGHDRRDEPRGAERR